MKHSKIITWLSATMLGLTITAFSPRLTAEAAQGNGTTDDGFSYTYDTVTKEATITRYDGNEKELTIPKKVGNYTVTVIGKGVFQSHKITKLTIPGNVKEIKEFAFGWCNSLTSVEFKGATKVDEHAFYKCPVLTDISLSKNMPSIGSYAFQACKGLKTLTIPADIKMGGSVFSDCTSLHTVTINGATEVGVSAFSGCTSLKNIYLSDSVKTIGSSAFSNCTSLQSYIVPSSIKTIEPGAFYKCSSLNSVSIQGQTEIQSGAFWNCSKLEKVQLSPNSRTPSNQCGFIDCPSLHIVNGKEALQYETDSNGEIYPIINPAITEYIRDHFCRSENVGFVDEYCTKLCEYIVKTETDPWMNDALKARQLHDWLICHCEKENSNDGKNVGDVENHVASSIFLSYAINARGEGMGETVCEGFAKAYTMLLTTAKIESHIIGCNIHVLNLVRINDKYYTVDVTNDAQYEISYDSFLKSTPCTTYDQYLEYDHPLLEVYHNDISKEIPKCLQDYPDSNWDGILDNDFDLDGTDFAHDFMDDLNAYQGMLRFAFGFDSTPEQINDRLGEVLSQLHALHKGYWDYVNDAAPVSVKVSNGGTAEFKVTLFGEDLHYQWMVYNDRIGCWDYMQCAEGIEPTLRWPADEDTNGMKFYCCITNQDGYTINSMPVTLTVI